MSNEEDLDEFMSEVGMLYNVIFRLYMDGAYASSAEEADAISDQVMGFLNNASRREMAMVICSAFEEILRTNQQVFELHSVIEQLGRPPQ